MYLVDGKKVDIPSYIVKPGQTVEMKEASRNLQIVKEALENCVARLGFVSFDETKGDSTYEYVYHNVAKSYQKFVIINC